MNEDSSKLGLKWFTDKINEHFQNTRITVEPVLFLHNMATQMVYTVSLDLMERKACSVNLKQPSYVCNDLSNYKSEETAVQSMVSEYIMWRSILEASIKLVSVPMLGWWADTRGSRSPLVLSLVFLMLESLWLTVNTLASDWPLEAILIGSFFYGISGGTHALLMLSFSYLANKTDTTKRTRRMGILDGFYYLGSPLGVALGPPIFNSQGYCGIFGSSVIIYIIVIIYVVMLLQEKKSTVAKEEDSAREVVPVTPRCSDLGIDKLTDSFYVTFKERPNRKYILVLILAMLFDSFVVWGESAVKYMFTQKALDWDYTQYSHYRTASSLLTAFGALFLVPLLVRVSMEDALIGFIGAMSRSFERVAYVCASIFDFNWFMYVGSVIGTASPLAPTAIRSHLSKLAPEDVNQIYAVMAVGESLLPFATAPIYTKIYDRTADSFSASFYLLSIGVNLLMGLCFLFVHFSLKKQSRKKLSSISEMN